MHGVVQRRAARAVRNVDSAQQRDDGLHALGGPVGRSDVQRCLPVLIAGIDICRVLQEEVKCFLVGAEGRRALTQPTGARGSPQPGGGSCSSIQLSLSAHTGLPRSRAARSPESQSCLCGAEPTARHAHTSGFSPRCQRDGLVRFCVPGDILKPRYSSVSARYHRERVRGVKERLQERAGRRNLPYGNPPALTWAAPAPSGLEFGVWDPNEPGSLHPSAAVQRGCAVVPAWEIPPRHRMQLQVSVPPRLTRCEAPRG